MEDNLLNVFFNDVLIGQFSQDQEGRFHFLYDEIYLEKEKEPLSFSLPLRSEEFVGKEAEPFFSGLLPDEDFRRRLARYLGTSPENTFSLLREVGRECAGAVSFYPIGEFPPKENDTPPEILDDKKLKELLSLMKIKPLLADHDDIRLSLAGAQNKMAVGFQDGQVTLIKNGGPTTHILKPLIERDEIFDSVQNEFFCMKLAKRVGLSVPKVGMLHVGDLPCYMVERYDRAVIDGRVHRIHQEDFCQALGIPPAQKYESDGGPSVNSSLDLLQHASSSPVEDADFFMKLLQFNYLTGNADAHGKNFSLLHTKNGLRLSPAYDLMSTSVYPDLSKKMAMKIGGKYDPQFVFQEHWVKHMKTSERGKAIFLKEMDLFKKQLLVEAQNLADEMNRSDFPSPVYEKICSVIRQRSKFMEREIGLSR